MFAGNVLPLAAHKCFVYHLIAMLKCFPKCVAQRKSIFEQFSPHYINIIQNSISFFIATWVRTVAKVLRHTFAVIKRGRIEGQQISFSLREKFISKRAISFPATRFEVARTEGENCCALKENKFYVTHCVSYGFTGFQESGIGRSAVIFPNS